MVWCRNCTYPICAVHKGGNWLICNYTTGLCHLVYVHSLHANIGSLKWHAVVNDLVLSHHLYMYLLLNLWVLHLRRGANMHLWMAVRTWGCHDDTLNVKINLTNWPRPLSKPFSMLKMCHHYNVIQQNTKIIKLKFNFTANIHPLVC